MHLISGVGMPDATDIPGSRYLITWVRRAGRAPFIIGTLVIIIIITAAAREPLKDESSFILRFRFPDQSAGQGPVFSPCG